MHAASNRATCRKAQPHDASSGLPEGRFPHGPPEDAASKVREHLLLFPRFFENPLPFLVGIYFEKPNGQRTTKQTRCQVELQHPAGVTCPSRETNLLANAC